MSLDQLLALGFDRSTLTFSAADEPILRVRCSQCEAAAIQGVPCHERGCPNARRAARDNDDD